MTVFSDLHFGENPWNWGPEQDSNSTRLMRAVLQSEKPDYVYVVVAFSLESNLDVSLPSKTALLMVT
jgi:hypothetical protein